MKKKELIIIKDITILIIILILIFSVIVFWNYIKLSNKDLEKLPDNYVKEVIDGDTFKLANNEIIRLICIDTPEKNQPNYIEAKKYLESLILNKIVRLEKDVSKTDKYNRSLRYAYVNDSNNSMIFINKELVKSGYATLFPVYPDITLCEEIEEKVYL